MNRILPFLIIVIVLVAAVGVGWSVLRSAKQSGDTVSSTPDPANEVRGADPPHVRGNPNAPVTLEEFGDFQCPTCGTYYPELKKIEGEFGDKLKVIFREYPLVPMHEHALMAAQAAESAGLQGKFWEMHDKLYENQGTWTPAKDLVPIFVGYAKDIGLDPDRFMKDLNGEAVAARIFQDGKRVHALNLKGTPSFFVNGQEVKDQNFSPQGIRDAINQALKSSGKS
jgi:protein-disulfide isomerase